MGSFVLSSFRFSLAHTASFFSHDARNVNSLFTPFGSPVIGGQKPSKTDTLLSEINRKYGKANL